MIDIDCREPDAVSRGGRDGRRRIHPCYDGAAGTLDENRDLHERVEPARPPSLHEAGRIAPRQTDSALLQARARQAARGARRARRRLSRRRAALRERQQLFPVIDARRRGRRHRWLQLWSITRVLRPFHWRCRHRQTASFPRRAARRARQACSMACADPRAT